MSQNYGSCEPDDTVKVFLDSFWNFEIEVFLYLCKNRRYENRGPSWPNIRVQLGPKK